ncbi:MAG: Imidazole glycerol phosphate synthase subunit HisF [Chitinophagaceae bacterium]|nr:Imidazole glycerol phosphate synthase subunit HisF [Chitinophagaceae bacterium]
MVRRIRVIPVLLIQKGGLVKSIRFKNYKYVGDPINAVRIFNDKEVDELVILDISATVEKRPPDLEKIKIISGEAFMPLAYGGGITTLEQIKRLISFGVEKVVLNSSAIIHPELIKKGADWVGSQSMVISIDVKKNIWGKYKVHTHNGNKNTGLDPVEFAKRVEKFGAGEIFLNSIDNDGTFKGFDLHLIKAVSSSVSVPVVSLGGAADINDFYKAIQNGASAVAAGSMFVFQGPHKAVLINYPTPKNLKENLFNKLS